MRTYTPAAALIAGLLGVSFGFPEQEKPPAHKYRNDALVYAELAKAPQKARTRGNPLEADPQAVIAGGILFEQHCAECHGDMAEGGKKGPSLRADQVQTAEPGAIFWILTNGVVRRGMPVWSKLPEPQRWQLVTYIKSLNATKAEPATPAPPLPAKPQP